MIISIIIAVLIIAGIIIFLKLDHHTKKIKAIILVFLLLMLYLSIANIFSKRSVDLKSPSGIVSAVGIYFSYVGHVVANLWDIGLETGEKVKKAVKVENETES